AVAAKPDEALGVGVDAVLGLWPIVALPWPAPALDEVAGLVEFEHRRRRLVALVGPHAGRALQDPGMATVIDRDTRHLAPHIFARQLGPGWIDFEFWNLAGLRQCGVFHLADKHGDGGHREQDTKVRTHRKSLPCMFSLSGRCGRPVGRSYCRNFGIGALGR